MADGRTIGFVAIGGVAVFGLTVVALHVLQPGRDPLEEAVSYYVHGSFGWLLTVGLLALGIGSLSIAFGLRKIAGRGGGAGKWLVGIWGVGVLLGGIFRADPAGHWNEPPSLAGMIHGNAAMVAFVALPLGALFLSRAFRRDERWRQESKVLLVLAVLTAVSLFLFFASLAPVFVRPGPPVLLGLSERVLLAVYAAWLTGTGVGIIRHGERVG